MEIFCYYWPDKYQQNLHHSFQQNETLNLLFENINWPKNPSSPGLSHLPVNKLHFHFVIILSHNLKNGD